MALVRPPSQADISAAAQAGPDSAERGANCIRRCFNTELKSALATAKRIHKHVTKHGRSNIETALGADGAALGTSYAKLKDMILDFDPNADVSDLPT